MNRSKPDNNLMPPADVTRALAGVFAPVSTPFLPNEDLDLPGLAANMECYAASPLRGYLALGSNGENRSLSEAEKLAVLRVIVEGKGPGQVVMAGATYDAQRDTERFLEAASDTGADFGLVLSPGYFRKQMTDEVLYRYFSTLADTAPLPLLLYNAPGFCGVTLSPALVGRLSAHQNIIGMKDSAASGVENFLSFESPSFHVLAGSANFLLKAMLGGSLGGTVSLANTFPALAQELFECGQRRDEAAGIPCQQRVTRINQAISGQFGVSGVKAAMNLAGLRAGIPRRPLLPLPEAEVERPAPVAQSRRVNRMSPTILSVDVGTTALKLAVYTPTLEQLCEATRRYDVNVYDRGKADIEPEKWWAALVDACAEVAPHLGAVGVVSLSVTTPGLTPMTADGTALGPGILFFDGRSHQQAREIRQLVGEEKFLRETCNLPVSGGSSLCSLLWIRQHQPDVWRRAAKFGHTNTYMVKRMTGEWTIDPSTTSITGLYNSARNDLTWNADVLSLAGIDPALLPPLRHSDTPIAPLLPAVAAELHLPPGCMVLCGGNDAVLAAYSGGLTSPGDINNICGTCEITNVCTDRPVCSPEFNVRCHVVPDRWLTFFVLNTGGKALEWFHSHFCRDLSEDDFYSRYIPDTLSAFFAQPDADAREADLPEYIPFLGGCRYTVEQLKAEFKGVTLETTREDMLLAVIRGNALYHGQHLKDLSRQVELGSRVATTGGGAKIAGSIDAKRRWTGAFEYLYQDQSSLVGAAMLGRNYIQRTSSSMIESEEAR